MVLVNIGRQHRHLSGSEAAALSALGVICLMLSEPETALLLACST